MKNNIKQNQQNAFAHNILGKISVTKSSDKIMFV